jgi:hypothetical protein
VPQKLERRIVLPSQLLGRKTQGVGTSTTRRRYPLIPVMVGFALGRHHAAASVAAASSRRDRIVPFWLRLPTVWVGRCGMGADRRSGALVVLAGYERRAVDRCLTALEADLDTITSRADAAEWARPPSRRDRRGPDGASLVTDRGLEQFRRR